MDWVDVGSRAKEFLKKYRYVALVLLAGIFLMVLPEGEEKQETQTQAESVQETTAAQPDLQEALSEILSKIQGAGKVQVLLTQAAGEEIVYQTDEDISTDSDSSNVRRETVILSGTDRSESGLIQQVIPPVYQGAIVLCQGADNASIKLAIVEAVSNATGLTFDKITVLKMK